MHLQLFINTAQVKADGVHSNIQFRRGGFMIVAFHQQLQDADFVWGQVVVGVFGWPNLAEDRDHYYVAGAICRPWNAEPGFTAIASDQFAAFAEPDGVKIAWTLEAAELGPALTRFATETRAAATDQQARIKFQHYWRKFGAGIILIRLVLLPVLRRRAEKTWRNRLID